MRLFVKKDPAIEVFGRTEQPGWASFPKTDTEGEYTALLCVSDQYSDREIPIVGLTATFPEIQILPEEEVLIVAPRCMRFKDGTCELNASVHDSRGNLKRSFVLGDGIEDVQVDRSGKIWVSYFDEGVFGNFGWSGDSARFGASGLTCFDAEGKRLWDFEPPAGFDSICDCYALNVAKNKVWAHYYSDFPIVRIDSDYRVRGWRPDAGGAKAFAVDDRRVLMDGGYSDRTDYKLLELGKDSATTVARVRLVVADHMDLANARVIGRDNELHVIFGDEWCVFSMWSLP